MASDAEIQALREMLDTHFKQLYHLLDRIARVLEAQARK